MPRLSQLELVRKVSIAANIGAKAERCPRFLGTGLFFLANCFCFLCLQSEFGRGNEELYTPAQAAAVGALLPDASTSGMSLGEQLVSQEVSVTSR